MAKNILFTLSMFCISLLSGCTCDNQIIEQLISPNGQLKIISFRRNCGTTTGFNTQVSILQNNQELKAESGNIFISDNNSKETSSNEAERKLKIKWKNNQELEISYPQETRIFKQETNFKNIQIKYAKFE